MADVDKTQAISIPTMGMNKFFVMHNYVDFTVAANQLAQNKTMALFDIPANVLVLGYQMRVVVGDTDIEDLRLGIEGATTNGFDDAVDIAAAGWFGSVPADTYPAAGGFISTSDAVFLLTNDDTDTLNQAKIHFFLMCVDLRASDTDL